MESRIMQPLRWHGSAHAVPNIGDTQERLAGAATRAIDAVHLRFGKHSFFRFNLVKRRFFVFFCGGSLLFTEGKKIQEIHTVLIQFKSGQRYIKMQAIQVCGQLFH